MLKQSPRQEVLEHNGPRQPERLQGGPHVTHGLWDGTGSAERDSPSQRLLQTQPVPSADPQPGCTQERHADYSRPLFGKEKKTPHKTQQAQRGLNVQPSRSSEFP